MLHKLTCVTKYLLFSIQCIALSQSVNAQDFLSDAQHMFFDQTMHDRRFGVEIEFAGLSDQKIEAIVIETLKATVTERLPSGELVFSSPFGEVKLKIEGQAWRYETDPARYAQQLELDRQNAPREIVLPPMVYKDADAIQLMTDVLKAQGAIGTGPNLAVSTQVNVEMPALDTQERVDAFVNLTRIYANPKHAQQIEDKIHVPAIRREYIGELSPEFLEKLFAEDYHPTAREFYDDYFYRQSLERLGFKEAWTLPLQQAQKLLLEQPDPVVPSVAKMLRLRISSHLLNTFREDPLTKMIVSTRWARALPIVEFREPNTDFKVKDTIEQALGIVRSAEVYGNYKHDKLVSQLTGIDKRDLKKLRKHASEAPIVRYALTDPKVKYLNDDSSSNDVTWIQLSPDRPGTIPLRVPGESVVYGRRNIHRTTILGKYNPGLENALIQQVLENKLFEAKVFDFYAPKAMPQSRALRDLMAIGHKKKVKLKVLLSSLDAQFPNGWVMKGSWDLGTERFFISDKLDFKKLIRKYEDGFEEYREKITRKNKGQDPEHVLDLLKEHPGYLGWKIKQLLANPDQVFFQARVHIKQEFRVEAQAGKVLGQGSTIDRYAYEQKTKHREGPKDAAEKAQGAEKFAQDLLNRLPEPLRFLPYGLDVALLEDGTYCLIETNPGGNSSFLEEHPASMAALDGYLKKYPELVKSGAVKTLSERAQMAWIHDHFRKLGILPETHYPGFKFTDDDVVDESACESALMRAA